MKIYNTLTRTKEEFTPLHPGEFRIYVCGPTVYDYAHVGNARPVCVFDTLRRYLLYRGYQVRYVSNITDIDDKLIRRAAQEGTTMAELAQRFEQEYIRDCEGLNVLPPTVRPRATEHIAQILAIVADILATGHGYQAANGDVYFRTRSFAQYGKLSHLVLEELEAGNRELHSARTDEYKEDPADFAIWKAAKPGEPAWDSPYGPGRPGWHIECSAMARTHLGDTIDLHAGGQDLIFPHHENEIAQSECANGCTFARYWMHNAYLNINNQKMSKSLGNFLTIRDAAARYGYEAVRYLMISAVYRNPLNFTPEAMEACRASLERLYTCRDNLDFALAAAGPAGDDALVALSATARSRFEAAMDDDLNTADALGALFDLARDINTAAGNASAAALREAAKVFDDITGVLGLLYQRRKEEIPPEVQALADRRAAARKAKDWPAADALRGQLLELGWTVEDTPQGAKLTKKS